MMEGNCLNLTYLGTKAHGKHLPQFYIKPSEISPGEANDTAARGMAPPALPPT